MNREMKDRRREPYSKVRCWRTCRLGWSCSKNHVYQHSCPVHDSFLTYLTILSTSCALLMQPVCPRNGASSSRYFSGVTSVCKEQAKNTPQPGSIHNSICPLICVLIKPEESVRMIHFQTKCCPPLRGKSHEHQKMTAIGIRCSSLCTGQGW